MSLQIVRNDIVKMQTEAIVNPAGETPEVGDGLEVSIYMASGYDRLHALRKKIGNKKPGDVSVVGHDITDDGRVWINEAGSLYRIDCGCYRTGRLGCFGQSSSVRRSAVPSWMSLTMMDAISGSNWVPEWLANSERISSQDRCLR